jgi:hypothetical protein
VCGIVSYYGNTDLEAGYKVFDVKNLSAKIPSVPIGTKVEPKKAFNYAGRLDILLGGHPEEVPDIYRLACPTTHVHHGSPPTLLMQGDDDFLVPLAGTLDLYAKLALLTCCFRKYPHRLSRRCMTWIDFWHYW